MQASNTFTLSDKWQFLVENQFRSSNHIKNLEGYELRAGFSYNYNPKFVFTGAYSLTDNWRAVHNVYDHIAEHRLWGQVLMNTNTKDFRIKQRIRLEERMLPIIGIKNNAFEREGNVMSTRIRYFSKYIRPIISKQKEKSPLYAIFQNEFFFNLAGHRYVNKKIVDQLRLFGGLGYRFNKHVALESLYLNQYILGIGHSFTDVNAIMMNVNMLL